MFIGDVTHHHAFHIIQDHQRPVVFLRKAEMDAVKGDMARMANHHPSGRNDAETVGIRILIHLLRRERPPGGIREASEAVEVNIAESHVLDAVSRYAADDIGDRHALHRS